MHGGSTTQPPSSTNPTRPPTTDSASSTNPATSTQSNTPPDTTAGSPASTTSYSTTSTLEPFERWAKRPKIDYNNEANSPLFGTTIQNSWDPWLDNNDPPRNSGYDGPQATWSTKGLEWQKGRPERKIRRLGPDGDLTTIDPRLFINRADYEYLRDTPLTQTEATTIDPQPILQGQHWFSAWDYLTNLVQHAEYNLKKRMQAIIAIPNAIINNQDPAYLEYLKQLGRLWKLAKLMGIVPPGTYVDDYVQSLDWIALIDNANRMINRAGEIMRGARPGNIWPFWRNTENQIQAPPTDNALPERVMRAWQQPQAPSVKAMK